MTVKEASAKANMSYDSGKYYYAKHLKNPNHAIRIQQSYQNQKNEFIDYVVRDKMSIKAASKKAKLNLGTAQDYYHKYFKVQNPDIPRPSHIATRRRFTQDQKSKLIGYIVHDKMSIAAASKKTNMHQPTGSKHYHRYLNDQKHRSPT